MSVLQKRPRCQTIVEWMEEGRLRSGVVIQAGCDPAGQPMLAVMDRQTEERVYLRTRLVRVAGVLMDGEACGLSRQGKTQPRADSEA